MILTLAHYVMCLICSPVCVFFTASDGSEEEMPELEGNDAEDGDSKVNRAEKKARKAVQKLGMKQVGGIVRVTIKKAKNVSTPPVVSFKELVVSCHERYFLISGVCSCISLL